MSREFKFRYWDSIEFKMHIKELPNLSRIPVMQYTGLKDKNGTEIYEGDIVRYSGQLEKVLWFDEGAQFITQELDDSGWSIMDYKSERYEVVGNIYENPELLK